MRVHYLEQVAIHPMARCPLQKMRARPNSTLRAFHFKHATTANPPSNFLKINKKDTEYLFNVHNEY